MLFILSLGGPGSVVEAILFRVQQCSSQEQAICRITDASQETCRRCAITEPINFAANLYYVLLTPDRDLTTPLVTPSACTLRIF